MRRRCLVSHSARAIGCVLRRYAMRPRFCYRGESAKDDPVIADRPLRPRRIFRAPSDGSADFDVDP